MNSSATPTTTGNISKTRKRIVYALLAIIVFGHLFDIATSKEHWPFSPYPMYATIQKDWSFRMLRVVGVSDTTPRHEIAFNATYLRNTLNGLKDASPARRARLSKAIYEFLQGYNRRTLRPLSHRPEAGSTARLRIRVEDDHRRPRPSPAGQATPLASGQGGHNERGGDSGADNRFSHNPSLRLQETTGT